MNKGVISVLSALVGAATGAGVVGKVSNEKTQKMKSMSDKHLALFLLMNQWERVSRKEKIYHHILKRTDIKGLRFMV